MSYEVYIDVVFVTNLLMDYFLLRIAGWILSCKKNRGRLLLAAAAGAIYSCVLLYIPAEDFLPAAILCHGACAYFMIRIGFGLKKGGLLVKAMVTLYLTAFLLGGFWEVLSSGWKMTVRTFFLFAFCAYFGLSALIYITASLKIRMKHIYPITISYRGKVQSTYGFYDTGNLLMEPVSGKPVSVVCPEFLESILPEEIRESLKHIKENQGEKESTQLEEIHPRFVPYRAVGKESGMLLAVTLEDLCIHTPKEVVHVANPVFAMSEEASALEKECKVLLNSKLLH